MDDAERKDRARKLLTELLPEGTTVYTLRIDYGRRNCSMYYYAILVMTDHGLQNISGHVARLIGRKWSNTNGNNWANSSGVLHRSQNDLVEQLINELFDAYTAAETNGPNAKLKHEQI